MKTILAQLREERSKLDVAISNLEHLEREHASRLPSLVTESPSNGIHRGYTFPNPEHKEGQ
ncbi:MAG: hypothetical protein ABSH56_18490 [Bryobacteraceae bacterium]